MRIESIQVGLPKTFEFNGKQVTTAINKDPIRGPVYVRFLNIDGDRQADLRVHGGQDKAVYGYGMDAIAKWRALRPGDSIGFGAMGENLSIDELDETDIFVGDVFKVGACELMAVQPRLPCFKLAVKYKDPQILKQFMSVRRPGVYYRVIKEGEIISGDEFQLIDREAKVLSISAMFDFVTHEDRPSPALAKEILKLKSLPANWHKHFEKFA